MALDATKLFRVAGADPSLWIYKTADAVATVTASGYFNALTTQLKQHDVIIVVGSTGGTATVDVTCVTSATGAATVTTTALEGVTAT
jgi:uncharacterized phosphosugar-binding protein